MKQSYQWLAWVTVGVCAALATLIPAASSAQSLIPILPIPPEGAGSNLLAVGVRKSGEWAAVHSYSTEDDISRIVVSRSQDGGLTWQESHEIEAETLFENWGSSPQITPDSLAILQTIDRVVEGQDGIQVIYRELRAHSSYDMGRTWNEPQVLNPGLLIESFLLDPYSGFESLTVREIGYKLVRGPGNTLYAFWERHLMRFRAVDGFTSYSNQRLLFRRSDNGGRTWNSEGELEIPLNRRSDERHDLIRFYPAVDVTGKIGLVYTDEECNFDAELQDFKSAHFFISSVDGGKTWSPPTRLPAELCSISGLAAGPADSFVVDGFSAKMVRGDQVSRRAFISTHDAGVTWNPPHVIHFPEGNMSVPTQICWNGGESWTALSMDSNFAEGDENSILEYQSLDNASTWTTPRRHVLNRKIHVDYYRLDAIRSDHNGTTIAFVGRRYFPLEDSFVFDSSSSYALPLMKDFRPLPRLTSVSTVVGWQLR